MNYIEFALYLDWGLSKKNKYIYRFASCNLHAATENQNLEFVEKAWSQIRGVRKDKLLETWVITQF